MLMHVYRDNRARSTAMLSQSISTMYVQIIMDYLKITQLEHVPLGTKRYLRDLDQSNILGILRDTAKTRPDWISILKCEQKWIKKT